MYDPQSRLIVTHRIADERMAEVQRAHLLRADHGDSPAFQAAGPVRAGRSLLGRLAAAVHHSTRPATSHRPVYR